MDHGSDMNEPYDSELDIFWFINNLILPISYETGVFYVPMVWSCGCRLLLNIQEEKNHEPNTWMRLRWEIFEKEIQFHHKDHKDFSLVETHHKKRS